VGTDLRFATLVRCSPEILQFEICQDLLPCVKLSGVISGESADLTRHDSLLCEDVVAGRVGNWLSWLCSLYRNLSVMESVFLRVMDWDATWVGLERYRPRPDEPISCRVALAIAGWTNLVALLAGPISYMMLRSVAGAEAVIVSLLAALAACLLNTALQFYSALCWNERAARLRQVRS
jgi:hypothetical protein